jgi:hypothetical protein
LVSALALSAQVELFDQHGLLGHALQARLVTR